MASQKHATKYPVPKRHRNRVNNLIDTAISKTVITRGLRYLTDRNTRRIEISGLDNLEQIQRSNSLCGRKVKETLYAIQGSLDDLEEHYVLNPRNPANLMEILRSAILQHDWESAGEIIKMLINSRNIAMHDVIIRAGLLVLMHHPTSNLNLISNFIKEVTGYTSDEDAEKFIRVIYTTRQNLLQRKARLAFLPNHIKLIQDPEYVVN